MDSIDILRTLFRNYYEVFPTEISALPGAGGDRRYYRLSGGGNCCIGTVGDNIRDSEAFLKLSGIFKNAGINVPEIYAVSESGLYYLQSDLGDCSLFSMVGTDDFVITAGKAMEELARLQTVPYNEWMDAVAYKPFSERQVKWDLNYFKYEYLKPLKVNFDEDKLEDDFDRFASTLMSDAGKTFGFMMRDCQSRNVMVYERIPYFIDYQGGRLGPALYDVASFLWQAKAGLSDELKERLFRRWAKVYCEITGFKQDEIRDSVNMFALFRTLQVLGAYGYRGLIEKRAHFIESIPAALRNLKNLTDCGTLKKYPELERICKELFECSPLPDSHKGLLVKVFSFSYKKGYPEDLTGNGGGFMFDCRGMHNPGRYEEYKRLTGLDKPVREFLEGKNEVQGFLRAAYTMVAPSVEQYKERNFHDLQIGFGCTGGQHRSVYCADMLGRALADNFPDVRIEIIHREQNIIKNYNR